jgi:hypothetical protein
MTKAAAVLLTLIALATSAQAQQRVFVSGAGLDTNPCTLAQPCRNFQRAHDIAAANAEINVLDPAGYGPVTITKGISIQAHGWGGIGAEVCNTCAAITVAVTTSDPVTLNGLVLDGGGTGQFGINITSGPSVQILNSVVRHFQFGILDQTNINGANLLIEDTIASDNQESGIAILPNGSTKATLSRITANNNNFGVFNFSLDTTIANSVLSNNSLIGVNSSGGAIWLAKTVVSGNPTGVFVIGTVNSYGDNYINDNMTPVSGGTLTPVTTQ